jgi:hypothetical protein
MRCFIQLEFVPYRRTDAGALFEIDFRHGLYRYSRFGVLGQFYLRDLYASWRIIISSIYHENA